jgi:hypothetical protein
VSDAGHITNTVISRLARIDKAGRLSKQNIIEATVSTLSRFDKAGSVHYKAYHKG